MFVLITLLVCSFTLNYILYYVSFQRLQVNIAKRVNKDGTGCSKDETLSEEKRQQFVQYIETLFLSP